MAVALHLARSKCKSLTNPSLLHLFSTSSNDPNKKNATANDNPPSISSYFNAVRASFKQQQQERPRNPSKPSSQPMSMKASSREILKNLSEFQRRSAVPPPAESAAAPSQSQPRISFQEFVMNLAVKEPHMELSHEPVAQGSRLKDKLESNSRKSCMEIGQRQ